jgi:hypothetical protein
VTDLNPCNDDIFANGTNVAMVHSVPAETVEAWVRAVRGWSQVERIDWHYIGGRARVAALGDAAELGRVRDAVRALLPALHAMLPALYPTIYAHPMREAPCAGVVLEDSNG